MAVADAQDVLRFDDGVGRTGRRLEEVFSDTARSFPNRIAVTAEDGELTYAELDLCASQLARRLQDAGVRPTDVVGLHVDRSTRMAVGMLAILKAGGAYLPIDPGSPEQLVRWTLEDAGARLVVTVPALLRNLLGSACEPVVVDEDTVSGDQRMPDAVPGTDADPAYVIYTSGSTGTPKGVVVEHANVVRLFDVTQPWFTFDQHDVWTMFHSLAFDFSVWELWGALLCGGRVVLVPYRVSRSPADMLQLLRDNHVTVLNQTPSAFRLLVAADARVRADLPDLRVVILGGERLDVGMLKPWFAHRGDDRPEVVNMYGITEVTVHASYRRIRMEDLSAPAVSPIGQPLPDLHFSVRDEAGATVADGEPGELHIAGPGVAREYLGKPELTAERFRTIADGRRWFRTGDQVARGDGADYVYLGRIDDQVKVRGFRVEPREIEVVLNQHPEVGASAVVAHDWGEGDVRLVAYVAPVTENDSRDGWVRGIAADLDALAGRSLPTHMRPSTYVGLLSLPMTANGKVDRVALPAPETEDLPGDAGTPDGLTPTEAEILEVWRKVVDVPVSDPDEDFFDLGGTSLALVRMFNHVNTMYGTDLPITVLLEGATVRIVAKSIDAAVAARSTKEVARP